MMLGHDTGLARVYQTVNKHIYKTLSYFTRCYFISRRLMTIMVKRGITENHIDYDMSILSGKFFTLRPSLISDVASESDNDAWHDPNASWFHNHIF